MLQYSNASKKYDNAYHTINKTRQIVMLYDGIIKHINLAKEYIDKNNIQERYNSLEKSCNIITGLHASLDFNNGGEIAKILDSFYTNIFVRIMDINISNSKESCDKIIGELKSMRDAWHYVDQHTAETTDNSNQNSAGTVVI
jgi:flagellar protein FliS